MLNPSHQTDHHICKKRKRGQARVFRFRTFGEKGHPVEFDGSFRENVKDLLELGHFERMGLMSSWSFQLEVHRHPPLHVLLYVVEEPVEASPEIHCRLCQYVGWGQHLVCNKKYHFVIPSKDTMAGFLKLETGKESQSLLLQRHVLHGIFHSNGFGHLLCLNGIQSGHSHLTGQLVMDFWDRLSTALRPRKVSLCDTSQKRGMELRLLHGVAHGGSWFGRWSYQFGSGTYGVTLQDYQNALQTIQNIPLCLLLHHHVTNLNHEIPILLSTYQSLSDAPLITLSDLFRFLLDLKSRLPKEINPEYSRNPGGIYIDTTNCRWSQKRIEMAVKVIIQSLKRVGNRWISRQEVRDAARMYIGDTGLLDFVLKSLGNQTVGNYLVRRSLNPVTKVLEYCLEDTSSLFQSPRTIGNKVTRAQVTKDIQCLYKYILMDYGRVFTYGTFNSIPVASRIILDAKYFIRDYYHEKIQLKSGLEEKSNVFCAITVKTSEDADLMLPYECITLKTSARFSDLKKEVERVFREIYRGMEDVEIEPMAEEIVTGEEVVFWGTEEEVERKIVFEGRRRRRKDVKGENVYGIDRLKYMVVECVCGAKEDDGERMVCCDVCEVWQHTRCLWIPNTEQVPNIFLCKSCDQQIIPLSFLPEIC